MILVSKNTDQPGQLVSIFRKSSKKSTCYQDANIEQHRHQDVPLLLTPVAPVATLAALVSLPSLPAFVQGRVLCSLVNLLITSQKLCLTTRLFPGRRKLKVHLLSALVVQQLLPK